MNVYLFHLIDWPSPIVTRGSDHDIASFDNGMLSGPQFKHGFRILTINEVNDYFVVFPSANVILLHITAE